MSTGALKAVGVFWDIENCCVPKGKSALKIIERIRERFFHDCREAEFICVCDIIKESESTIKDLNDGQINVVHINATAKNAADDKIRQSMRRFSDSHPPGTKIILISSDVNFASDLSDLRHRKKFEVLLIHKAQVSEALLTCATEHFLYEELTKDLPVSAGLKEANDTVCIAYGYDKDAATDKVSTILKMLSSNCGGKVISIGPLYAILKFSTPELMERAKKRMNGEDVYGRKITVCLPDETPFHLNNKKWNQLTRRKESPSPQRRPGRERSSSRGYYKDDVCDGYNLVPASDVPDQRMFRTPGGPARQEKAAEESPVSPNHTHTLPNSNSAKYYTKASDGPVHDEGQALLKRLAGDKGSAAISLSSGLQQISLKDIPLPPSGYQFMPPPNMASMSSTLPSSRPDEKATAVVADPIKLFEETSRDSQLLKPGLLGPMPGDGDKFQPGAYFKHPEPAQGSSLKEAAGQTHQQARSLSVPSSQHGGANDDSTSENHGYSAAGTYRSQSQSNRQMAWSATKEQHKQHQQQHPQQHHRSRQVPGGFNRRASPANRPLSSSEVNGQPGQSPDLANTRPYSPSSSGLQGTFRPRLPSAPGPCPSRSQRTPSPFANLQPPSRSIQKQKGSTIYRVPTPVEMGDPSCDYIHPDFRSLQDPHVELVVSNLDYNISPHDWRKVIYATFQPHVKILSIEVRLQADNTSVATLRLPTEQDARFAIAQYHRRKIGYKRINVQLKADCSQSPAESLRMDTVALLMEERDNKMALSRLIDLFDKRFHKTVSVSDVYKMRDTIQITEVGGGGRWVRLQPGVRRPPTPGQNGDAENLETSEQRVCPIHCIEGSHQYVEALNLCMLPNVLLLRKHFSPQLHSLLLSHNGYIPLMSFPVCYAAEFRPIEAEKEGGIPLEHVISCVPGVEICVSKAGVKNIQFQQNREPFYDLMKGTGWQELGKISREVMELLRQQPTCTMPVSKFIPAYHHYFGKQCRVADYGYTKLQELFEAIPHAIQVLGTGDRRAITLSPRAQLKRFTTDIVKVVKAQPAKQIMLDKFPTAYEDVLAKPLFLPHYGVCHMEDILSDIPTTTLIVIEEGNHTLLALPRRDQTAEEVERTKKFSLEVVDLLKTCPQCCMSFNKFIPAYHHHFGRQCRVADYGFSKLADLFEAVSHVVRLGEEGEERLIQLTVAEMRSVLCEQLASLLRSAGAIQVNKLQQAYASRFNFGLKLEDYGVQSTRQLLMQLKNHIRVETYNGQEYATLVKEFQIPALGLQVMQLLMDESGGCLPLQELCTRYESTYGRPCDIAEIKDKLSDYIQVEECGEAGGLIRLSLQQSLGRNLRLLLLHRPGQRINMGELYAQYRQQYGVDLSPALYGFTSLYQLLLSFPHILEVRGKPTHKYLVLSGMLAQPGMLPPARVDVTTTQPSISSPNTSNSGMSSESVTAKPSSSEVQTTQLIDSAIISQSPPSMPAPNTSFSAASTRILDMLNASTAALPSQPASSNQFAPLPTPPPPPQEYVSQELAPNGVPIAWQMLPGGQKVYSGNIGASASSQGHNSEEEDLFSPCNGPLDSSSATLQHNSSSQSSLSTSSPVKRRTKPRIAANFTKQ